MTPETMNHINELISGYECDLAAAEARVDEIGKALENLKAIRDSMENEANQ